VDPYTAVLGDGQEVVVENDHMETMVRKEQQTDKQGAVNPLEEDDTWRNHIHR
jgi:hypothetical protein